MCSSKSKGLPQYFFLVDLKLYSQPWYSLVTQAGWDVALKNFDDWVNWKKNCVTNLFLQTAMTASHTAFFNFSFFLFFLFFSFLFLFFFFLLFTFSEYLAWASRRVGCGPVGNGFFFAFHIFRVSGHAMLASRILRVCIQSGPLCQCVYSGHKYWGYQSALGAFWVASGLNITTFNPH